MMLESQEAKGPSFREAKEIVDACAQLHLPSSDSDSHSGSDDSASPGESYADPCAKCDVLRMTLPSDSMCLRKRCKWRCVGCASRAF